MRFPAALAALAIFLPSGVAPAQGGTPAPDTAPRTARPPRPFAAVRQALLVNVVVNRVDAWALNQDWARTGTRAWGRNLRLGWEWDEDHFGTNLFAHPYHGGLYFNAGRANGLGFWEAAPVAFAGSWTWEYLGETHRPSLNDFYMTSFGGIALGEVFHRLAATIRDNRATGSRRTWREIAALPLDPLGGVNRMLRGDWTAVGPNPPEGNPGALGVRLQLGARLIADELVERIGSVPTMIVDFSYGDPFLVPYRAPFDAFRVRAMLGEGGITALRATGRLYGTDLNGQTRRHRHLFMVSQRFDYVATKAYRLGGQSVELGFDSRWQLGRDWTLRSQFYFDGIMLGGIDAPGAGIGLREYDFGPGGGVRFLLALGRRGATFLTLFGQSEYIHAVSGAGADHYVGFGGFELNLPVTGRFGVGIHSVEFLRLSRYTDRPEQSRRFPELRLLASWTPATRPRVPAAP